MSQPTLRALATAALRLAMWLLLVAALLGVMSLYLRPDFLVRMADALWSCF